VSDKANGKKDLRLPALRRFALAITALNVAGHTVLGFEQAWATPLLAVAVAYATELLLESLEAWRQGRRPRFLGPGTTFIDFLLSPHITGLAVAMLLYPGAQLLTIAFGSAAAIASKYLLRAPVGPHGASRHFLNPSNFGITATLLAFPTVGISQPYMFTEKLNTTWAVLLPVVVVMAGTFLNARFTRKIPLILGWVGGFVLQAAARSVLFGNTFSGSLLPLTGMAVLLFTFYMVTDPATTPTSRRGQVLFGLAVAFTYAALVAFHVVFAIFFSLTVVCFGRGALLYAEALLARRRAEARQEEPAPQAVAAAS
jgi:hypothetical protein